MTFMSKPALRWPLAAFATVMSALFKSCTVIDQFHIAPVPEARNPRGKKRKYECSHSHRTSIVLPPYSHDTPIVLPRYSHDTPKCFHGTPRYSQVLPLYFWEYRSRWSIAFSPLVVVCSWHVKHWVEGFDVAMFDIFVCVKKKDMNTRKYTSQILN